MSKVITFAFLTLCILVVLFVSVFYMREHRSLVLVTDFASCVANGYMVEESTPRTCVTPDGKKFTESISDTNATVPDNDMIRVTSPRTGTLIKSPFEILGEARGNWFFEASFPAILLDENGVEIAVMPVTAQGEWMTENFVPFSAMMMFGEVTTDTGTLVLKKDNPSGLPEFDAEIRIPVTFDPSVISDAGAQSVCRPTGCSGQLCADQDLVSTCEFKEEYACYAQAVCERQQNGECGWTQTPAFATCVANAQK